MVVMLCIPIRKIYGLEGFITETHLDNSAKVMLATGLIVGYGYIVEAFMGWYSGNRYEAFTLWNRLHGPYGYFVLVVVDLQHLYSAGFVDQEIPHQADFAVHYFRRGAGRHVAGAVCDRGDEPAPRLPDFFVGYVLPDAWDWMTYVGTIGMFLALIFLFVRVLPMISIFEMRTLLPEAEVKE